jgi:hypothetical protein
VQKLRSDRRAAATRNAVVAAILVTALSGCGEPRQRLDPVPQTASHRAMVATLCSRLAIEEDAVTVRGNFPDWCLAAYRDLPDAELRNLFDMFRRIAEAPE